MDDGFLAEYEALPFPPRDPAEEDRRLIVASPGHIREIDHYLFAGRRDFSRPFRALIAGGGTGDATVMLAQQLADAGGPGEVVHLEDSHAASDVARARAERRGLRNIRFVDGAITDLGDLGIGRFDYIGCASALHRLADPAAGLKALMRALVEDGGMGLALPAPLGRIGVYHAQAMLRMLAEHADHAERMATARALIGQLPPTNWLRRNPYVGEHLLAGDAGLYDLLMCAPDRAFTVPEIDRLAQDTGLRLVAFIEPVRYEPRLYVRDSQLLARLNRLSWVQRAAFAELLCGNFRMHVCYAVKAANAANTVAQPDSRDVVPVPLDLDGPAMEEAARPGGVLKAEVEGIKMAFPMPGLAPAIMTRLDGRRSLTDIHADIAAETEPAPDWGTFARDFGQLYGVLNGLNLLFLRHPQG